MDQYFAAYVKAVLGGSAILTVVVAVYATLSGHLPVNFWAFRCGATGYAEDSYMSYCGDPAYGDYEHLALYNGLEPEAVGHLKEADFLFLGNSKARRAFSAEALAGYFRDPHRTFFNLGLNYGEYDLFPRRLMEKYGLHPKAVVINADPFFYDMASRIGTRALEGADGARNREGWLKRKAQGYHRALCQHPEGVLAKMLCGDAESDFRSLVDGRLTSANVANVRNVATAMSRDPEPLDMERILESARRFKALLDRRNTCMILTVIPFSDTDFRAAEAVARELKVPLILVPAEGYMTYDGNHMFNESAERWATAFLERADSELRRCMDRRVP